MLVKTSASIAICLGAAAVSASPLVGREPKRVPAITSSGPASSQGEGNADVNIVNKNEIYDLLMGCAQQDGIFCGVACTPKTAKCCHSHPEVSAWCAEGNCKYDNGWWCVFD